MAHSNGRDSKILYQYCTVNRSHAGLLRGGGSWSIGQLPILQPPLPPPSWASEAPGCQAHSHLAGQVEQEEAQDRRGGPVSGLAAGLALLSLAVLISLLACSTSTLPAFLWSPLVAPGWIRWVSSPSSSLL